MINKYQKIILDSKSRINLAMKRLNLTGLKIILVTSKKKLIGTITDGDIRRAFLKKYDLNSEIINIANRKPIFITEKQKLDNNKIYKLMLSKKIDRLPLINSKKEPILLYRIEDFFDEKKKNIFFIMAGGEGKRLLPITKRIPKPLVKINNQPIILNIIKKAKSEGFYKFIVSVNYLADKIINFLGNGDKFGVKISYIREKKFLGTAGSIGLIDKINNYPILLTNCDVITNIKYSNLLDYHLQNKAFLTVGVRIQDSKNQFGLINLKGNKVESFLEKPVTRNYINSGIYVFDKKLIKFVKKNQKLDFPNLLSILNKNNKRIIVYPFHEKWIDIGTKKNLKKYNSKKKYLT